jgi:hypothetical protein
MKKLLFLLSAGLIFAGNTQAAGGTCSDHGGVDCAAGYDYFDGSAICNDGWRDSTEKYWSVKECPQNEHPCSPKEEKMFENYSKLPSMQSKIDADEKKLNQLNQSMSSLYGSDPTAISRENLVQAYALIPSIQSISADLKTDNSQYLTEYYRVTDACYRRGRDVFDKYGFNFYADDYLNGVTPETDIKTSTVTPTSNELKLPTPARQTPVSAVISNPASVILPASPVKEPIKTSIPASIIPKAEPAAVKEATKPVEPVLEATTSAQAATSSEIIQSALQVETVAEPALVAPVITSETKKEPNFVVKLFQAIGAWFGGLWK